jgi:hypothetical protein
MISSEPLFSFKIEYKNVCQLEGSDHGGRDSAAELALAGTIDVQLSNGFLQPADFGASPIRPPQIIHLRQAQSTDFCLTKCQLSGRFLRRCFSFRTLKALHNYKKRNRI